MHSSKGRTNCLHASDGIILWMKISFLAQDTFFVQAWVWALENNQSPVERILQRAVLSGNLLNVLLFATK